MYTDDSKMTFGGYKGTRIGALPEDYLQGLIRHFSTIPDSLFKEYLLRKYPEISVLERLYASHYIYDPVGFICDKRTFATKRDADDFRKSDKKWKKGKKWKGGKRPIRSYECPRCGGWHVTSKTVEEYEQAKNNQI